MVVRSRGKLVKRHVLSLDSWTVTGKRVEAPIRYIGYAKPAIYRSTERGVTAFGNHALWRNAVHDSSVIFLLAPTFFLSHFCSVVTASLSYMQVLVHSALHPTSLQPLLPSDTP